MATLEEIRSQYPQYSDLSDRDLAAALHAKYYADIPMEDFSKRIGLEAPTTSKTDAYLNASIEGGTFGMANKMAAGSRLAEERDLPLSQQMMQPGGRSDLADLQARPGSPGTDESTWDTREDGSAKGRGWLGLLRRPDGDVSSELSVGVEIDGKETEIPLLVPTLTRAEIDQVLSNKPPRAALDKAVAFARQRIAAGKDPFASPADSPQPQNGFDLFKEQMTKGQATIDASRKDYPDIFKSVEPIAGATTASLFAAPATIGSMLAQIGASGAGGALGSGVNEANMPNSTPGSVAKEAAFGGMAMGGAELGGALLAKMASKVVAPGVNIPYVTPMRDKIAGFMGKVPGVARNVSDSVIGAMPEGAVRDTVASGIGMMGTAANATGKALNSPFVTSAALPITTAIAGPMVSIPLRMLRELMQPGALSRYLARKPLSQGQEEALRQAITLPGRQEAAP